MHVAAKPDVTNSRRESCRREFNRLMALPSAELRSTALDIAMSRRGDWSMVALALLAVKCRHEYVRWKYVDLAAYAAKELGFTFERQILIGFVDAGQKLLLRFGISTEVFNSIGPERAAVLVKIVIRNNVNEYVATALRSSPDKLRAIIDEHLRAQGKPAVPMHPVTHWMTDDEEKTLRLAEENAAPIAQNHRDGHLVEMISFHFLIDHLEQKSDLLELWCLKVEQLIHVKILAVDKDHKEWRARYDAAREAAGDAGIRSELP